MRARPVAGRLSLIGLAFGLSTQQLVATEPTEETEIDEIVMYAVESSSPARLMRYFFLSDKFNLVGEIYATDGRTVDDVEALAYVASGPYKGLYGIATEGPTEQYLSRISPMTAEATVYGSNLGGQKITGMISDYDYDEGEWTLLATDAGGKLRRIDVETGNADVIANVGEQFEGLARNSNGIVYANTNEKLFRLEKGNGNQYNTVPVGSMGLDNAESLEFAFGNNAPTVEVPGVNDSWTEFGVLFVFDDDTNRFGILNPTTGQFKEYLVNGLRSNFSTQDAEGMIFVTSINDPLYGSIDGFD